MVSQEKMTGKRALWFVLWTFILSWAVWGFLALNLGGYFPYGSPQAMIPGVLLGACSPAIIMFVLIKKWGKTKEEKAYFKPIFRNKYSLKVTVSVTLLFCLAYFGICALLTERIEPLYMLIVYFPIMIIGGGLEEIGWRGFLQPTLEKMMPFWLSAIVVGVIHGLWHLPLYFIHGTSHYGINFLLYIGQVILFSFVLGALYRLTGSVVASITYHAWNNVMASMFSLAPLLDGDDSPFLFAVLLIGLAIIATAAVYIHKWKRQK